jgi:four helix bundle protein
MRLREAQYKSFEEMPVWNKAIEMATRVFGLTENLPRKEDYGLTSQLRRSALSVSAHIAEAFGREHTLNKLNFYYNSRGSLSETKSNLIYGRSVGYFEGNEFKSLLSTLEDIWFELNKIISALRKSKGLIKSKPRPRP